MPHSAPTVPHATPGHGEEAVVVRGGDDGVLVVMLNRPAVANALDPAMLAQLTQAMAQARDDRWKAVVLAGAGRHFCAGADVAAYARDPAAMRLEAAFHPPLLALAALRKPVVAALNGATAGGALGLALAADLRIMGASARLHPAWIGMGLVPDLGVSWMLPRLIGPARAYEWLALGEPMDAGRALDLGLANAVVDDDCVLEAAMARAARLAAQPEAALAMTKQLLIDSASTDFAAQIAREARFQDAAAALRKGR